MSLRGGPEQSSCHAAELDFLDGNCSGPEGKRQRQDIRLHGGGLGVFWTLECQQERGRTGSGDPKGSTGSMLDSADGRIPPRYLLIWRE